MMTDEEFVTSVMKGMEERGWSGIVILSADKQFVIGTTYDKGEAQYLGSESLSDQIREWADRIETGQPAVQVY